MLSDRALPRVTEPPTLALMPEPNAPLLSDLVDRLEESTRDDPGLSTELPADAVLVLGGGSVAGHDPDATSSRRSFLAQASALSLAIPRRRRGAGSLHAERTAAAQ
jgi:hypothetical protein